MYDAAIIGTGPAGVSAALTLHANGKNFIWIGSEQLSDKVQKAERITNYPGLPMVSGAQMNEVFRRQCAELGIAVTDRMVNSIIPMEEGYALMAGPDFYEAKTVLLATGVVAVGTLPGETDLLGKGVSYCATCDGALYRGKTIAVLCGAKRFEHEVAYLAELAQKVYCLPLYRGVGIDAANVEILQERIVNLKAENDRLCGIVLKNGDELAVDGLFCLRESVSPATLLPGLAIANGHIETDRHMATNLPGVFAAGDCTGGPLQVAKAVGEGLPVCQGRGRGKRGGAQHGRVSGTQ